MGEHADLKLVSRLLKGDQRAFDAFFASNYPRLYRFALARLDNDHDLADETAQNVLCQAISKMSTYRGEAALLAWFLTFCRHEISKQRKARKRAQGDTPLREDDPAIRCALESLLASTGDAPDAAVYQSEIARLVKVTLDYLPSLYADALELKYVHDLPVRDIAERIGKSAKATESVLTRAGEAFREAFRSLTMSGRATGPRLRQFTSNTMKKSHESKFKGEDEMDDIGRLIRHTGGRDAVPEDRFDDARENVQSHWQQVVDEHRRGRFQYRPIAVAASVVVAVIASALLLRPGDVPGPVVMASVDRVLGNVVIDGQTTAAGNIIEPGAVIETRDDSRVALRLADGQSLRLDTLSRIVVHTANEVTLENGGIYIDTEHSLDASPVLVMTALGQARDVGTQFQVRLAANVLIVGVRDGLVEVTRPDRDTLSIDRGRVVELNTDGSESERDLKHDDAIWTWVETVAPDFDVNGATLEQYLSWYTGQRGLRLVWSDPGSEQKAKLIMLTGSLTGTTLQEGFETVQRIAPFEHRFEDDTLWVSLP